MADGGVINAADGGGKSDAYSTHRAHHRRRSASHHVSRTKVWAENSITTELGVARGLGSSREHDRLYRATLQALADGLILGKGRHGVVVALCNDPTDPRFSYAVKVVSKVFVPSSKHKEGSFHRVVSHTLHVQNEVAAMAKLSAESTFVLPLYCALQDDAYVYLVMERACCSLKQLIQHSDEAEEHQLLSFQEAHPLKFISFCALTSAAMLHACWSLTRARLIHHDIHPAQILVTQDGRPCLADLGQCSVIPRDGRKQLLPPLGRRDFCRPARLGPLQGAEVDGYGCGATLWVTWKGCYDGTNRIQREWNRHEERESLQRRLEYLAQKARDTALPQRWPFAQQVLDHLQDSTPQQFATGIRAMIEGLVTPCQEEDTTIRREEYSSFSVETPFGHALPFLRLGQRLATDPSIALEPTNFALPAVLPEEPWPPPESSMVHSVYLHAQAQLRLIEQAAAMARSRSRAARPELPELPIPLTAEPCISMLLHPGRVMSSEDEIMVRIAIVSMHVRDALPSEMFFVVRASPWDQRGEGRAEAGGGGDDAAATAASASDSASEPLMSFSILRSEFAQEGPSGPVEAKRVLLLRTLPSPRSRVVFEMDASMQQQLGFCATPPLLVEHRVAIASRDDAVRDFDRLAIA